jgi:hypothetical protein
MNNSKTLEVLIPTYNRPERVVQTIKSCLAIKDPRLSVRCNSNGFESSLEKLRNLDKRLVYDCFETNQGILANMLFLLNKSSARYAMLLSDEDKLNENGAKKILDFLDELPDVISVISCSIFDEGANNYYFLPRTSDSYNFNLNEYMMLGMPAPSYISGLIFSTKTLRGINLERLYRYSVGNAYPHLDLLIGLLEQGSLRFYSNNFVIKGVEHDFGGEGYEHRSTSKGLASDNLDLNPLVYGPKARARQFYYQDQVITNAKNVNEFSRMIAKLYNFIAFYEAIKNSGNVTILPKGCDIRQEVFIAKYESIFHDEWSGSIFSKTFIPFIKLPWSIGSLNCRIFIFILRVFNKFLWRILQIKGGAVSPLS